MSDLDLSYVRISPGKIAGSMQLADDVIADYDAKGGLVGLEFLSAAAATRVDEYTAIAGSSDTRARLLSIA